MESRSAFRIGSAAVELGQTADVTLKISESYCGSPINLPMRVMRGPEPGPTLFITGAVHGDELNGTGIVRELIVNHPPTLRRGTLVLVPVVNMMGFERHSRYMPDRRDLNRCFPGSAHGSLTARLAHAIFDHIIRRCDFGIDLHSAANFRTNVPNVRADLTIPGAALMAKAFGCELIINNRGPASSLRRAACSAGCPTIVLEAGETWKVEPAVLDVGVRGIQNVLVALDMTAGSLALPQQQNVVHRAVWVRAAEAGLLQVHIAPGDRVEAGQPIATNTSLLGRNGSVIRATVSGIVMGLTTLPSVKPGDPVCHIALPNGNQPRSAEPATKS